MTCGLPAKVLVIPEADFILGPSGNTGKRAQSGRICLSPDAEISGEYIPVLGWDQNPNEGTEF